MRKVIITKEDLEDKVLHENARVLWDAETVRPLTKQNLFNSAVYALLSARENYPKLMSMVKELKKNKITSPDKVIGNYQIVRAVAPRDKTKHLIGMSKWWKKSRIGRRIIEDYNGERVKEREFRKEFMKDALGFGHKCSTLFLRMVGYEAIAPIDIWALRYLRDNGYDVHNPDIENFSGGSKRRAPPPNKDQISMFPHMKTVPKREYYQAAPSDTMYEVYEGYMAKEAAKYGFTPAKFQCLVWTKYSSMNDILPVNGDTQTSLFRKNL